MLLAGWTTLVQAETLSIGLGRPDLVVLDCRFDLADSSAGEYAWMQAHIPGARYANLDRDLSGALQASSGRHPWPEAAVFCERLGSWGIDPQSQVVAYDADNGAFAARAWFLLRALGHEKVAVLDGGWKHWTALGLPVDNKVPVPITTRYHANFDARRILDAAQVVEALEAGDLLVDARAPARFRGEEERLDRAAGHVPGAVNRPLTENLVDGRFKPPGQLAEEFRALLGGLPAPRLIAMCGSGVTACHHLLAMERAGMPGARLFAPSWSGWISDPGHPIATGG
jgi:thiosulfate/3-mercaptopyruvate sulfurtransferase